MKEKSDHSGLTICFRGSEWTPDHKTRYMAFWARYDDQGFAGETEFDTTERAIQEFADELQVFYQNLSNYPRLKCGAGDKVYFDIKFSKFDSRGTVLLDCAIRANSVHGYLNSTQIYRTIQLMRIDEINSFCQIILTSDQPLEMIIL